MAADNLPIWIRLPVTEEDDDGKVIRRAFCPFTGLSRTKMMRLAVPSKENGFNAPVLSISFEEDRVEKAGELDGAEDARRTKKRGGRWVRLIRLRGPSPHPKRLALLDYLDNLALQGANAEGEE